MSNGATDLAHTVKAMRPMLPAKDFAVSTRFYTELGFRPETLAHGLVEMHMGPYSFILQNYYVPQWADNFVMHMRVADVRPWWDRIVALDLASRYGVKTAAPKLEDWGGLVAVLIDPCGVLWKIIQIPARQET